MDGAGALGVGEERISGYRAIWLSGYLAIGLSGYLAGRVEGGRRWLKPPQDTGERETNGKRPATRRREAWVALTTLPIDWMRIGLAFVVPTVVGLLAAALAWKLTDRTVGSVIGAGVIVMGILLIFSVEFIEIMRFHQDCRTKGIPCRVVLNEFTRYGIYGVAGFIDAAVVFGLGLRLDERAARRTSVP